MIKYLIASLFILSLILWISHETRAHQKLQDKDYVTAIVGEAANQDFSTMVCIAHALRNRGNLTGVYGYTAEHVWTENYPVWHRAWAAWDISAHEPDELHGAKNFGSTEDLKDSGITADMIQCGDFYFY